VRTDGSMSTRVRITQPGAVAIAVTVALAAAGCGGENEKPATSIESAPTTPRSASSDPASKPPRRAGGRGASPNDPRRPADGAPSSPTLPAQPGAGGASELQRGVARAIRRLPRGKRDSYVRSSALVVLAGFGFEGKRVVFDAAGTGVRAAIPRGQACSARAETEGNVAKVMRSSIPWLTYMQVVVEPGGQRLSQYVRANCRAPALPSGRGEVLLSTQGVGPGKTRQFRVRSRRWTVEYLNGGRSLHMLVLRDGYATGASLDATRRGPGRRTFSGPGTFSLQIASTGEWVVRVRAVA
jgi:hypothetical protein